MKKHWYQKKADPFYLSKTWRNVRRMVLERDHYLCQDCLTSAARFEHRAPRQATTVHHIISREQAPDRELDLDNLISLCDACHNKRHPEKGQVNAVSETVREGVRVIKV